MISKNIAQKHISTAKTDKMLENSATDTSIAVTATNIVVIRTTVPSIDRWTLGKKETETK